MLHKNAVIFALFHRYIIGLHEAVRKRCGWRLKSLVFLAGERGFGVIWWCLLLYGLRLEVRFDGEGRCVVFFGIVLCGAAIGLSGFVCVVRLVFC